MKKSEFLIKMKEAIPGRIVGALSRIYSVNTLTNDEMRVENDASNALRKFSQSSYFAELSDDEEISHSGLNGFVRDLDNEAVLPCLLRSGTENTKALHLFLELISPIKAPEIQALQYLDRESLNLLEC